jgi:hypothetical protein
MNYQILSPQTFSTILYWITIMEAITTMAESMPQLRTVLETPLFFVPLAEADAPSEEVAEPDALDEEEEEVEDEGDPNLVTLAGQVRL